MALARRISAILWILLCALQYLSTVQSLSKSQVTCGSTLKLEHTRHEVRLHSHEVQYGSGSGQQSVTGVKAADDVNSYWVVRGHMQKPCVRGHPVKCGDEIRLEHLKTRARLHSHHFLSPLSNNQEVSCYAGNDGAGDTGDHWRVECSGREWTRGSAMQLKHVDTGKYLHVSGHKFNRPIAGQYEVSTCDRSSDIDWKAMEGVYITSKLKQEYSESIIKTEL